mgnify:CR=1 FL=1
MEHNSGTCQIQRGFWYQEFLLVKENEAIDLNEPALTLACRTKAPSAGCTVRMPRLQESCQARVAIESREYGGGSSFSSDDGPPPLVRTLSGRGGTESACDACACVAVFVTAFASVVASRQHPI